MKPWGIHGSPSLTLFCSFGDVGTGNYCYAYSELVVQCVIVAALLDSLKGSFGKINYGKTWKAGSLCLMLCLWSEWNIHSFEGRECHIIFDFLKTL